MRAIACAPGQSTSAELLLASGGHDTTVHIWHWNSLTREIQLLTRYTGHREPVHCLAWSPDGSRLASGDNKGMLHIWDSRSADPLLAIQAHHDSINTLAWAPGGQYLASAPGGQYLASAGQDGVAQVYQVAKRHP